MLRHGYKRDANNIFEPVFKTGSNVNSKWLSRCRKRTWNFSLQKSHGIWMKCGFKAKHQESISFHLTWFETSWHTMVVKLVWLKWWFSDDRLIRTPRKTQKKLRISCEYTGDKNGTLSHERAARLKGRSSSIMFLGHSYASDTDITHKIQMWVWDRLHKFLQNKEYSKLLKYKNRSQFQTQQSVIENTEDSTL